MKFIKYTKKKTKAMDGKMNKKVILTQMTADMAIG